MEDDIEAVDKVKYRGVELHKTGSEDTKSVEDEVAEEARNLLVITVWRTEGMYRQSWRRILREASVQFVLIDRERFDGYFQKLAYYKFILPEEETKSL